MHWDKENRTTLWYKVIFPTATEIGIAKGNRIGQDFRAADHDFEPKVFLMTWYDLAPEIFGMTCWR